MGYHFGTGGCLVAPVTGKALETVEHVDPSEYQKDGGEKVLFKLLDARFPERDQTDELAEVLNDVFSLRATEGESLRAWISRATELFDRCERKGGVKFPEEARGFMLLRWSGLSEEQQAVVKGRSLGVLKREEISKAMRSCYPDFVVGRRKAVALVEDDETGAGPGRLFLIDETEEYPENDVAEVLASTWKEKRAEIARLQKSRKFEQAKELKRSFRVEIEEMKKKTKCNRCHRVGHWARECRQKRVSPPPTSSGSKESGAGFVAPAEQTPGAQPEFVASVGVQQTLVQRLRQQLVQSTSDSLVTAMEEPSEIFLVSSPGFAVLDSGCGKTIIGDRTLQQFQKMWKSDGRYNPSFKAETNVFKFGNGERETTSTTVVMPVGLAGRYGTVQAAIVQGDAPLLLSRPALKKLGASIDFHSDRLQLFQGAVEIQLKANAAGQYVLDVMEFPKNVMGPEVNVVGVENEVDLKVPPMSDCQGIECQHVDNHHASDLHASDPHASDNKPPSGNPENPKVFSPAQDNDPVGVCVSESHAPSTEGVPCPCSEQECHAVQGVPKSKKVGGITKKQLRKLKKQVANQAKTSKVGKKYAIVEVFCPPRFVPEVEKLGLRGLSMDTCTGWDLDDPKTQEWVLTELKEHPPELLVACPPCTDAGGWFHLNSLTMPVHEVLRRKVLLKKQKAFCKKLIQQQLDAGGRVLFEHPSPSCYWDDPTFNRWCEELHSFVTHMCCYNLHVPAQGNKPKRLIRKSTRLLCSHADMCVLRRNCPGASHPDHREHRQVAGSEPGLGSVSKHAGRYTPEFVRAVLDTIPQFCKPVEVLECSLDCCQLPPSNVFEALALQEETDPEKVKQSLMKLHRNLGHPSNSDLVRILKHGQASDLAVQLARELSCDFCTARKPPTVPNPGKVSTVTEFNQRVGLDVKYLDGWKPNQKISALNIVDHATSFQLMLPFFETETSAVLRKLYLERWVQWAGPPREVILDPARTNLGKAMVEPSELEGTHVHVTAAGAHWQLGKTEVHGGWFNRVLSKVLETHNPQTREEWLECVIQSHVKNQMIQSYGFTPSQRVFGKNPELPGDLLNEPQPVIPNTGSLHDDAIAKAYAVRTSARKAVLELHDDRTLRKAMLARPRREKPFVSGDVVAYWRDQKWNKGLLSKGGKWYGSGVVLGLIGRNVVIAHRNHILRCAPEQVRLATAEEKTLIETPGTELLGIKDMIEGGTFRSSQYVDLVSQSYPPQEQEVLQQVSQQDSSVSPDVPTPPEGSPNVEPVTPAGVASEPSVPPQDSVMPGIDENEQISSGPSSSAHPANPEINPEVPAESYGPVRRSRVLSKSGPLTMFRPSAMRHDDFVEVMNEVVPQLIEQTVRSDQPESSSGSERKREAADSASAPAAKLPKIETPVDSVEYGLAYVEAASCSVSESCELWENFRNTHDNAVEVLINQYYNKRAQKEIPTSRNEPFLQAKVDQAKVAEWQTLIDKKAVRVVPAKEAAWIKKHQAHRIMGSRFVIVKKPEEDIIETGKAVDPNNLSHWKVKARWCLQGHLDPDLTAKVNAGQLQSPTLSQMGRTVLFQLMATFRWQLQLGDVKGAFLEAGPLPKCYRPLYARIPAEGIPGIEEDCLIEVLGNVYGQNDAPAAWYKVFNDEVLKAGFERSKFDNCLYWLKEDGRLVGALGAHVDDTATGGSGVKYQKALAYLKQRFPYRKWRVNEGEFCGAHYRQDVQTMAIHMSQKNFAEALKPVHLPQRRKSDRQAKLDPKEISILRGINGSLNWISTQSRPDLAAQTSISQQSFPDPTVHHLLEANNVIRRAKQFADLEVTFQPIPAEKLRLCCHSDAAWANVGVHTQAGYVIGFTTDELDVGKETTWTPAVWKSFKLSRAVGSTLAAEAQSMVAATGTLEWTSLLLAEAIEGIGEIREYAQHLKDRTPEKVLLQDLLARAGVPPEEAEPSTPGSFSVVDAQSMTDASKRRGGDIEEAVEFKRGYCSPVPYQMEGPPQPTRVGVTPRGKPIYLPQDVPTVSAWGRSVIQFGKYMSKRGQPEISYAELFEDVHDPEKVRYVKWVIAQTESAKGLLLDLASYLCVRSAEMSEGNQMPFIPGTSTLRVDSSTLRCRLVLGIRDFAIQDRVHGSVFSRVLACFEDEEKKPRPSMSDMLYLRVDELVHGTSDQPDAPQEVAPEYSVELQILPLQLTVDQDTVKFAEEFWQDCCMSTYVEEPDGEDYVAQAGIVEQENEDELHADPSQALNFGGRSPKASSVPLFFQEVKVGSLFVAMDYKAKRIDTEALKRGELWQLVNALPILEGLEVRFTKVVVYQRRGLEKVLNEVAQCWGADLDRTQVLRCLSGITPIRSIANISGGFAEMVLDPLKQYLAGEDAEHVSRTMLRGVVSFLRHVTVESIDLTERVFVGAQAALEYANSRRHLSGRSTLNVSCCVFFANPIVRAASRERAHRVAGVAFPDT
eukprot:s456_g1.t1